MRPKTCITTSWDDGHPLDYRVAELLIKYGLPGTFYVPMTAENGTMAAAQIRELSHTFEIGAHTLHHVDLNKATEQQARQQIIKSKSWLEDSTGRPCSMFCPPKGKYSSHHLQMIKEAGFSGVRTVELLSIDFPRLEAGVMLLPTTIQAHPHGPVAYAKNAIKRAAFRRLWLFLCHGYAMDWARLARALSSQALECGGVFHLWGHSWELQRTDQWHRLEEVLRFMSECTDQASSLTNGQVCERCLSCAPAMDEIVSKAQRPGSAMKEFGETGQVLRLDLK